MSDGDKETISEPSEASPVSNLKDTSPRASGPAGAQFEVKVATHYALALLAHSEAFGLPGVVVDRIEFQRRGQGHPLDDIIIKGNTSAGDNRCLEVQAKRSMSFTEKDSNFADIVGRIVESRSRELSRKFAVAVERTSGPIENGVQEALELSRHTTDSNSFFVLLETSGRSNNDMRNFIAAFRKHLADNRVSNDEILYEVLKSFSVLVFDYARPQSNSEHNDRLRSARLASDSDGTKLYDGLFGHILSSNAIGGETNRANLIEALKDKGIEIRGSLNLADARSCINEMSDFALSDISTKVCGQQLARSARRCRIEELLSEAELGSGIVEITGPGGAGKSGLLKLVAEARLDSSRIIVLSPDRTKPGGWSALKNAYGIDATAEVFLQDLSCDGGGLICIDGLDRFRDPGERNTVKDVLTTSLRVKGVTVLFTARTGWEKDIHTWFGDEFISAMSSRRRLVVEGLDDNEAQYLADAVPALAPLLRGSHPARALARNPFVLRRLANTRADTDRELSEAELAWDWWNSGAHMADASNGVSLARRRVLLAVTQAMLSGNTLADISGHDATVVTTLFDDGVLSQVSTNRAKFKHDLFSDWAIACVLSEEPSLICKLSLGETPPFWLSRGFELACRRLAEEEDKNAWPNVVRTLDVDEVKDGWIGLALLSLVRSELASDLLKKHSNTLLQGKGELAARLVRRVISAHAQPVKKILRELLPTGSTIPQGIVVPSGSVWPILIAWLLERFDLLPSKALSAAIELFEVWLRLAAFGEKNVSSILLNQFSDLLVSKIKERDLPYPRFGQPLPLIKYPVGTSAVETARTQLTLFAHLSPNAAERFLTAISESSYPYDEMRKILEFSGQLPSAVPGAFSAAFKSALKEDEDDDRPFYATRRRSIHASYLEGPFVLGHCGISLFTKILDANRTQGIDLIVSIVLAYEDAIDSSDELSVKMLGCVRRVSPIYNYGWSRGYDASQLLTKALQALEYWAHQRIDSGEAMDDVIAQIVGDRAISSAILLVIVDLVLSHSSLDGELLADLVASPDVLALDAYRAIRDAANRNTGGILRSSLCNGPPADATVEEYLLNRVSRSLALHSVITQIVFSKPEEATAALRERIADSVSRLGEWEQDAVDWGSPVFMASHALRLSSKENYDLVTEIDETGVERKVWSYRWPEEQYKWRQERSNKATADRDALSVSLGIRMVMDSENKSMEVSVANAVRVLVETSDVLPSESDGFSDPKDPWLTRVAAAAYIARFASEEEVQDCGQTISGVFDLALEQAVRSDFNLRFDVMYDAHALAITGSLYLVSRFQHSNDHRKLLGFAGTYSTSSVSAFSCHRKAAESLGEKTLLAAIRIGLQACVSSRQKDFDEDEEAYPARQSALMDIRNTRLTDELQWIEGSGDQPEWPSPPLRRKRRMEESADFSRDCPKPACASMKAERPDYYFNSQTAVVWLRVLSECSNVTPSVVCELLNANRDWLVNTNSHGDENEVDAWDLEMSWTRGLFECAAAYAKDWSKNEKLHTIFDLLDEFSDEAFIQSAAAFLVRSDLLNIEGDTKATAYLVDVRQRLWTRLKKTKHWQQHLWSPGDGMEIHLKELIAAFFFKQSTGFGGEIAYMKRLEEDQIVPFLSILSEVTETSSPCPVVAVFFLDVVEHIEPQKAEAFLLPAAIRWSTETDHRFWSEFGVGRRVCEIVEKIDANSIDLQWIGVADAISAAGVSAGEMLKQKFREGQ